MGSDFGRFVEFPACPTAVDLIVLLSMPPIMAPRNGYHQIAAEYGARR